MLSFPAIIPISRYQFTFRITRDLFLPPYAGSTLRGVFGHALLDSACTCGQGDHHSPDCIYSHIFLTPPNTKLHNSQQNTPPQSYVFEPPLDAKTHYRTGENFIFQLVLFGKTRLYLSLIVSALRNAFSRGVGSQKGTAELIGVELENNGMWQNIYAHPYLLPQQNNLSIPDNFSPDLHITLHTPLRIKHHSNIAGAKEMSPDLILRQAMRRVSAIAQLYFEAPISADYAALSNLATTVRSDHYFYWHDWQRYSNRQQQSMKLGGVVGKCTLYDVPHELATFLHIGQWTHIGKETVFGLGKIEVEAV